MGYKIKITREEKEIIFNISNNNLTQKRLLSIYSQFLKYGADTSQGYKQSFTEFFKVYRFNKLATTKTYLKKLVYKLVDFKLLEVKKQGKFNVYFARRVSNIVSDKVSDIKSAETCMNNSMECTPRGSQELSMKKSYININHDTVKIQTNNKELLTSSELCKIALDRLKDLGKRSNSIKLDLLRRLQGRTNVAKISCLSYIDTVIADAVSYYEFNREKYAIALVKNRMKYKCQKLSEPNFTQRNYDYEKLEKQLLGWDFDN